MITRLAKAGLAAALSVTTIATGAAASSAEPASLADAPAIQGPHVTVSAYGLVPSTNPPGPGIGSVGWTSAGTQDLTGPTHITVDLPPGLTTDLGMFFDTPPDYVW